MWFKQVKFLPLLNWTSQDPQLSLSYSHTGVKWRPNYNCWLITSDSVIEPLLWKFREIQRNSEVPAEELLKKSAGLGHCEQNMPLPTELEMSKQHGHCRLYIVDCLSLDNQCWAASPLLTLRPTPGRVRWLGPWAPSSTWHRLVGQWPK